MIIRNVSLILLLTTIATANSNFTLIKKKKKAKRTNNITTVKKETPYYDNTLTIIVSKHDYELKVYDAEGWLATYPVVFGNGSLADKKMEGDRCTPEGTFRIINKNPNHKWDKFVLFDYPTAESYAKFIERKRKGEIPQDANIGGSVGIHGTWPGSESVVDNFINWTEGCISMKNADIDELFTMLPLHTKLIIQH